MTAGARDLGERGGPVERCDLGDRRQVGALVKDFYRQVSRDDLLGPIFNQIAEVDWYAHLELLTNYWCRVLLGENGYHGAILQPHKNVHALQALTSNDFSRWYQLWCTTIDSRHQGKTAERAKVHAAKIARMLSRVVTQTYWSPSLGGDRSQISSAPVVVGGGNRLEFGGHDRPGLH